MEKKSYKPSTRLQLIDSARLMASLLKILLIIFVKGFIKLNVSTDMITKKMKLVELHTKVVTTFFNI